MKKLLIAKALVLVVIVSCSGYAVAGAESENNTDLNTSALVDIVSLVNAPVVVDEELKARLSDTRILLQAIKRHVSLFERRLEVLESKDQLVVEEIQTLMSDYNRVGNLATNLLKKRDDTARDVIDKIR